jgi:hypothetical protein
MPTTSVEHGLHGADVEVEVEDKTPLQVASGQHDEITKLLSKRHIVLTVKVRTRCSIESSW